MTPGRVSSDRLTQETPTPQSSTAAPSPVRSCCLSFLSSERDQAEAKGRVAAPPCCCCYC